MLFDPDEASPPPPIAVVCVPALNILIELIGVVGEDVHDEPLYSNVVFKKVPNEGPVDPPKTNPAV